MISIEFLGSERLYQAKKSEKSLPKGNKFAFGLEECEHVEVRGGRIWGRGNSLNKETEGGNAENVQNVRVLKKEK